jgi:hypothetical protein
VLLSRKSGKVTGLPKTIIAAHLAVGEGKVLAKTYLVG